MIIIANMGAKNYSLARVRLRFTITRGFVIIII